MGDLIDRDAERLAQMQTRDNGKTIWKAACRPGGPRKCSATTPPSARRPKWSGQPRGNYFSFSTYEPIGVVAAITPWNSPLTMDSAKLAPALAAGNAIILNRLK